jgi:tetratricopeptide (TPR) repeat protein
MKRIANGIALGLGLLLLGAASPLLAQSDDYAAKASIIQGIEAFDAGAAGADSLFALGERHSELAQVAAFNQGRALLENQEAAQQARQSFQRAIKENDDPAMVSDAWHNIGNSLLMEQDLENAIDAYKSALRSNPGNEAARYNLSYAIRQLNQQQDQQQDQQNQDQQDQDQQDQQQDGEQQQNQQDQQQDGEQEQDQQQDGEQQQDQQEQQDGEQDQEREQQGQEGEQGEQDQQQDQQPQPQEPQQVEGQISKEDMERILESLERGEEEVQAKLMKAKSQGKKKKIEKDW